MPILPKAKPERVPQSWAEEYHSVGHFDLSALHSFLGAQAWAEDYKQPKPAGWVYAVQNETLRAVKFGRSLDPLSRLRQLQTGSSYRLRLIGAVPSQTPRQLERRLHERFRQHRLVGEWFAPDRSLLDLVFEIMEKPLQYLVDETWKLGRPDCPSEDVPSYIIWEDNLREHSGG